MKYLVTKPEYDGRSITHGILFPDNYYRIIELTRSNGPNIESLSKRGYTVEEYEGELPAGLYGEADDVRYTDESVADSLGGAEGAHPVPAPKEYVDQTKTLGQPGVIGREKPTKVVPKKAKSNLGGLQAAATQERLSVNRKSGRAA